MTIYGLNMDGLGTDTRESKIRRVLLGALYGFVGGAAFVLTAAFIDIWFHPELPLGVNWSAFWSRLPLFAFGLALVGAVTCWWHEAWQGLISGAATAAAFALIVALFSAQVGAGMKFIVLIFILLPIAAMTLPVAYLLRWITERHAQALRATWSAFRVAVLFILIIAVGGGLGYFMKTPDRGIEATRFIHNNLQDLSIEKNPLPNVKGVPERNHESYKLYPVASENSTEGFDIYVNYEDGYTLRCTVVMYPGRPPFFTGCRVMDE